MLCCPMTLLWCAENAAAAWRPASRSAASRGPRSLPSQGARPGGCIPPRPPGGAGKSAARLLQAAEPFPGAQGVSHPSSESMSPATHSQRYWPTPTGSLGYFSHCVPWASTRSERVPEHQGAPQGPPATTRRVSTAGGPSDLLLQRGSASWRAAAPRDTHPKRQAAQICSRLRCRETREVCRSCTAPTACGQLSVSQK